MPAPLPGGGHTTIEHERRTPIAGGNQRKDHSPLHQDREADRAAAPKGYESSACTKDNIKAFESTAKKYGIDFALKKDSTETPPRYLVFFKGRDADALTAAFKEFSAKKLTQGQKPSIRKLIVSLKEKAAALNAQRDKVKNKDRGIAR